MTKVLSWAAALVSSIAVAILLAFSLRRRREIPALPDPEPVEHKRREEERREIVEIDRRAAERDLTRRIRAAPTELELDALEAELDDLEARK